MASDHEHISLLKELLLQPKECEWLELKQNNSNPQEIGEYISALSNSACYHKTPFGYLVFGIKDDKTLVETTFKPTKVKKGNQELENWLATQLDPKIDFNILEFNYNGLEFVIFKVGATKRTPVLFRGVGYIRVGSYKKKLNDHPEKARVIWNRDASYRFENEIAKDRSSEDDLLALIDYPAYFDLLKMPLPDNRKGIIEKFRQDKIVKKPGATYQITNLGALLFAKDIEEFENLSRKAVRVIFYQGNNRIKTRKEQIGKKGYAVGFQGLIKYIEDQLPANEEIGGH